LQWELVEYPDRGECCVCGRETDDLSLPIQCTEAEEILIWAFVSPAGPSAIACCPECIEHGIFNRPVSLDLSRAASEPILSFLRQNGVPFTIVEPAPGEVDFPTLSPENDSPIRVEFYPKQKPAFLDNLAALLQ